MCFAVDLVVVEHDFANVAAVVVAVDCDVRFLDYLVLTKNKTIITMALMSKFSSAIYRHLVTLSVRLLDFLFKYLFRILFIRLLLSLRLLQHNSTQLLRQFMLLLVPLPLVLSHVNLH